MVEPCLSGHRRAAGPGPGLLADETPAGTVIDDERADTWTTRWPAAAAEVAAGRVRPTSDGDRGRRGEDPAPDRPGRCRPAEEGGHHHDEAAIHGHLRRVRGGSVRGGRSPPCPSGAGIPGRPSSVRSPTGSGRPGSPTGPGARARWSAPRPRPDEGVLSAPRSGVTRGSGSGSAGWRPASAGRAELGGVVALGRVGGGGPHQHVVERAQGLVLGQQGARAGP